MLYIVGSASDSTASCLRSRTNDILYTGLDTVFLATAASRYFCCFLNLFLNVSRMVSYFLSIYYIIISSCHCCCLEKVPHHITLLYLPRISRLKTHLFTFFAQSCDIVPVRTQTPNYVPCPRSRTL